MEQIGGDALSGDRLDEALRTSQVFVSLVTFKYTLSACCRFEIDLAVKYSKKIIGVLIGNRVLMDTVVGQVLETKGLKCFKLDSGKQPNQIESDETYKELLEFIKEQLADEN